MNVEGPAAVETTYAPFACPAGLLGVAPIVPGRGGRR